MNFIVVAISKHFKCRNILYKQHTLSQMKQLKPKLTWKYWWWLSWKIVSGRQGCHQGALKSIPEWSMMPLQYVYIAIAVKDAVT